MLHLLLVGLAVMPFNKVLKQGRANARRLAWR